jgi:hypothetical protein
MKINANHWLAVFVVLFVTVSITQVAAAKNMNGFSPAHLKAAERLVYALGMYESLTIPTKRALEQMRAIDPAKAELMTYVVAPFITKEYIGREFREFVAGQFDMETCGGLSEFWEGPVGRKFVTSQVQLLTTGKAAPLTFTPAEESNAKLFEKTKAFLAFSRAMPAIEERLALFTKELNVKMAARMNEELARRTEKNLTR